MQSVEGTVSQFNLPTKQGLRAAVIVKEISTVKEKPGTWPWSHKKGILRSSPQEKQRIWENANSFVRGEGKLRMPLNGFCEG